MLKRLGLTSKLSPHVARKRLHVSYDVKVDRARPADGVDGGEVVLDWTTGLCLVRDVINQLLERRYLADRV